MRLTAFPLQVATTISILIPRGPKLYLDPAKIYTPKVAAAAAESERAVGKRPNVSGESSSCIASQCVSRFSNPLFLL